MKSFSSGTLYTFNILPIDNNTIAVDVLNLNCEFGEIRKKLNEIAERFCN